MTRDGTSRAVRMRMIRKMTKPTIDAGASVTIRPDRSTSQLKSRNRYGQAVRKAKIIALFLVMVSITIGNNASQVRI
jgi:hypothetical protein